MIYAIGIDSDSTFLHFLDEATRQGEKVIPINLRAVTRLGTWRLTIPDDGTSFVRVDEERIDLDPQSSYFCRIIDLSSVQADEKAMHEWRGLVTALCSWLECIPGVVINRPGGHAHNLSKPLHEEFLRQSGFHVPESLTSSDKQELLAFASQHETVLKPVSGLRANCTLLAPARLQDFGVPQGPIHLQHRVSGADIRCHVVGRCVHAEIITSEGVDYRHTHTENRFAPYDLPSDLVRQLICATASMGIQFAGWDFKYSAGNYWCLEANPMPGYDGYDRRLGGRITRSLLELARSGGTCSEASMERLGNDHLRAQTLLET